MLAESTVHPMKYTVSLRWRHTGRDRASHHQPHDCWLNRLFRRRSNNTSKFRVTGFCAGNSPRTGEFPAQMASNAENVSIWWRHHVHVILRWNISGSKANNMLSVSIFFRLLHMHRYCILPWCEARSATNAKKTTRNSKCIYFSWIICGLSREIYIYVGMRTWTCIM